VTDTQTNRLQLDNLDNMDAVPGTRFDRDDNPFGLLGIDHVALPATDMDVMARFIGEVLGGEFYYVAGYDETDRELNRSKHVFMRVGPTLVQFASPQDGQQKVGKSDYNSWPHWAFGVTAEGMRNNVARLRELGIPVWGPVEHRGVEAVSAYFTSPEGHKLELVTYEPEAVEQSIGVAGAPGVGQVVWGDLFHDWPNT
jgi:catechol 2,3-dioxygenase-like lactoylglutathione lyase family enzyme